MNPAIRWRSYCLRIGLLAGLVAQLLLPYPLRAQEPTAAAPPDPVIEQVAATPTPLLLPTDAMTTTISPETSAETSPATSAEQLYFPAVANGVTAPTPTDDGSPPSPTVDAPVIHDDYYLAALARLRNEPPFVAPSVEAAAPEDWHVVGQWGPVVTWPFVFASAASLPDGRIAAWGGNNLRSFNGGTTTYAAIWDPTTNGFLSRNLTDHSAFCAIPTMLEDGRVFLNGGDGTRERTSIFDYRTNAWQRVENMNTGRWYNGAVALPNGKVFTLLGDPGGSYPELWTAGQGWSLLTGANLNSGILNFGGYQSTWLPYLHLAPSGQIFHSGPTTQMNWLTPTGNGAIANAGLTNTWYPKYSSAVMYDEGKILVAGGAANSTNTAPGTNQAMVINLNGPTPTQTAIAPMAYARKFNNAVMLPTGEVLIVGGNTSGVEFSDSGTILTPEIWNPQTQSWRSGADMSVPRNYHSVALLMTDGRVWSGGGGLCNCSADHPDHQIYSPPYLFNPDGSPATRPTINAAPDVAVAGQTLTVQATPGLQKFSLIKLSGVTHNLNSDLRYLAPPFSETASGQYQLTLHSNTNVLTPGYWMLFGVNANGVPSVAKVFQVSTSPVSITSPGDQTGLQGENVTLGIVARDAYGAAITYSATGLPAGLSLNSSSGVINGTLSTLGTYQVTITATSSNGSANATFRWSVQLPGNGTGQILRQWWTGVSGTAVSNLTGNANYPNNPTGSELLSSFEAPTNWADNYGTRIRGYVHAPITGQYRFWIASDDNSQLLLSTNANPANASLIASVSSWTNSREWTKLSEQQSALITLQAGQKYYIEALQKEGTGGDNLAVAWQLPGGAQEVIDGRYLSPWIPSGQYRYVRLEALSEVNNNPWTTVAEFNVLDGNGNPLSRGGWTVTADSQETQGENGSAANAIDGNPATFWHTQWQAANPPHPHWLTVNLGTNVTIGGFRYLPRQDVANGRIANYKFYISADGINWANLVAQGNFPNDTAEQTVLLTRPPVLVNPGNQSGAVGTNITLALSATDPDNDPLTFSATGLPAGLTINSSTGVISGAPTTSGSYNSTVTVSDGRGGAASQSFAWSIAGGALTLNPLVSPPKAVNSVVDYTVSFSGGSNPRFKWLFGDGSPETAYSSSPTVQHTFTQPGIYVVRLTATDDTNVERSITFAQAIHLPLTANRPAVSMNILYEARSGANGRVWLVNPDNDTVSVFDAVTHSKVAEIAVGKAPRTLAIAPNGRIWVTNKGAATISILDPTTLTVVQTVTLPYASQPFGLAFAPGGGAAYVALEAGGKLLRLDPTNGAQTGSVTIGVNVRHLSISGDGSKVYATRFITPRLPGEETATPQVASGGGEVLVIDTASLSVSQTILLRHSDKPDIESAGRGLPNYLGPLALSPDGVSGWTPSKQDNILRGALRDGNPLNFQHTVRAISSRIDLTTNSEEYAARIDYDNAGVASTALFDRYGVYLFVALETNREVAVVDVYGKRELFRIPVGRAPQGLALAPDGQRLYVHNFMERTVSVLDISPIINEGRNSAPLLATYNAVATEKLTVTVLTGKRLFYDAKDPRLALDSYISCAACHNDGGQDGRVWDLTGFGEGLRNTINLQGRAGLGQGFLHWSGNFDEVQDFEGQIRNLAGGTGLMSDSAFNSGTRNQPLGDPKAGLSADLDALAAYVTSLTAFAPSPYRNSDGSLTSDGAAGRALFQTANCAQCHGGTAFTTSAAANLQNIGTIKPSSGGRLNGPLTGIDTPTLRDVWATAPYLHDGSATTLADAVRAHNGVTLADADLAKLVAYLQQIGSEEASAPTTAITGQIRREWWTNISGSAVSNLTGHVNYPYAPSGNNLLTSFEAPTNWADNYGTRIRGYLHAPVSGQYRFWIASDDSSQLLLSTSQNPASATVIASVSGWTNAREWTKYSSQQSALITLQAGQRYYIEALQKEGSGGDNLAVAWQIPGGAQGVIPGTALSPFQPLPVTNVAQGKSASQSSTRSGGAASRAVDGNTNGNFSAGSVTQTNSQANAWWQVNLGATYAIDSIQLWNRTDCCANRLSNFYVFVSTTDLTGRSFSSLLNDTTVWRFYSAGQAPVKLNIPAYVTGRYVRVQLAGSNNLSLAEVQVYTTN